MAATPKVRIATIAAVAAAVPVVWCIAVLDVDGIVPIALIMALTSVAFWSLVGRGLCRAETAAGSLGAALVLGAASPLLCAGLMTLIVAPLAPVLAVLSPETAAVVFAPFVAPIAIFGCPEAFLPVGVGMGLLAWALARAGTPRLAAEPAAPACDDRPQRD